MKPIRTIKFVARQTGLSIHAIRVWERRYGAVRPIRASNNRRLYSEADVERLRLLHEATAAGHSIGQIARAPIAELKRLVSDPVLPFTRGRAKTKTESVNTLTANALAALTELDGRIFSKILDRAAVELGSPAVLQEFIAPLAEQIGELWRAGEISIAHEHFATQWLTQFLHAFARPYAENSSAPHLIFATPTGQLHELGAIIAAAAARSHGWNTTYFGPSLPIAELAGVVEKLKPSAVGLSIVFPPDDQALEEDLEKLSSYLPKGTALLVGGRSADSYAKVLRKTKAIHIKSLPQLFPVLDRLQATRKKRARR